MSKNISLSSARAFPSPTPFSSRFGGLRPSFIKNRAHLWRKAPPSPLKPAGGGGGVRCEREEGSNVGASACAATIDEQITSVDASLGRLVASPHATFSFPQTHLQLLVQYQHPLSSSFSSSPVSPASAPSASGGSSAAVVAAVDADAAADDGGVASPQEQILKAMRPFTRRAVGAFAVAQQAKLARDEIKSAATAAIADGEPAEGVPVAAGAAKKKGGGGGRKGGKKGTLLPSEALQCLADDRTDAPTWAILHSKRINAWSLYAKARATHAAGRSLFGSSPSSSSLAVVMPSDCSVLPAAEGIAAALPHRFLWLPLAAGWEEAGPLAPDSPFRAPVHASKPWPFTKQRNKGRARCNDGSKSNSIKEGSETVADAVAMGGQRGDDAVPPSALLPQQAVQLRALVPIVSPLTDCSLDRSALMGDGAGAEGGGGGGGNAIAAAIYAVIFTDCVDEVRTAALPMTVNANANESLHPPPPPPPSVVVGDEADAPPLPTISLIQSRVRDSIVMPLLLSAAARRQQQAKGGASAADGRGAADIAIGDDAAVVGVEAFAEVLQLERAILRVRYDTKAAAEGAGGVKESTSAPPNASLLPSNASASDAHSEPFLFVDRRSLGRAVGWGHFVRWLGPIESAVDGSRVRLV